MTRSVLFLFAMVVALDLGPSRSALADDAFGAVTCEGTYRHHLQGVCTDDKAAIFWSFTTTLVMTNAAGEVLQEIEVENHHGDLCHHEGRIYVAVNLGRFNDPEGKADSWVYVYRVADLGFVEKHQVPELVYGAGGMAWHDGKFVIIGGLPEGTEENYAYVYTPAFEFIERKVIDSGYTRLGVQSLAFAEGHWWFGCYGSRTLKTDAGFEMKGNYGFDCSLGVVGIGDGKLLVAKGTGTGEVRGGSVAIATLGEDGGLVRSPK